MTPQELQNLLIFRGCEYLVITDFESRWGVKTPEGKDLSLSKMTTEEYIRNSHFKVFMMGIKFNDDPAMIVSPQDIDSCDFEKACVVCHNAYFDVGILSQIYGKRPGFIIDTLSMARAKHGVKQRNTLGALAKLYDIGTKGTAVESSKGLWELPPKVYDDLAEYCQDDCEICFNLLFKLLPYFKPHHFLAMDIFIRMFTEGKLVGNADLLKEYYDDVVQRKDDILLSLGLGSDTDYIRKELRKRSVFCEILEFYGVEIPLKLNPKGELIPALAKNDAGMKSLLDSDIPEVAELAAAKLELSSTIEESRAFRLYEMAKRGPLMMPIKWFGTHTFRCSGFDKINPQNFTKGSLMRRGIEAPPGYTIVKADSSQVQGRLTPWFCGDEFLEQFRIHDAGVSEYDDVYCWFASIYIYGYKVSNTKEFYFERFIGKQCVLALGFGLGWKRYAATVKMMTGRVIDEKEARSHINAYRKLCTQVVLTWKRLDAMCLSIMNGVPDTAGKEGIITAIENGVELFDGTILKYDELKKDERGYYFNSSRGKIERLWGGVLLNNIIQGLEQILMQTWMIQLYENWDVVLQEHDSLLLLAPDKQVDNCVDEIYNVFTTPPNWASELPLGAEVEVGKNMLDMTQVR